MIAGVGFSGAFTGTPGPRANSLFGKQANNGGWFSNFRIPFLKSFRLTARLTNTNVTSTMLWTIIRGSENLRTNIGGFELPLNARLVQHRIEQVSYKALDLVTLLDVPSGQGLIYYSVLSVASSNLNFLEGCYHLFVEASQPYPGLILATGTEDYFVSAFYFNAGEFYHETSGLTHLKNSNDVVEMSAYRLHDQDPLFFRDGARFVWRNGDVSDVNTGLKCTSEKGNNVGSPTNSVVTSHVWAYIWDERHVLVSR